MSKRHKNRFDSTIQRTESPMLETQAVDASEKPMREVLRALDAFSNQMARTGFGTNNLLEATEYPITRVTNNYMLMQSLYRSNWIAQRCVDVFPEEMCKVEPELTCQLPPEDLDDFHRAVSKTNVWRNLEWSLKLGNLFGGAGAIIVIDRDENFLDTPLDIESIRPDSFRGIIPFDRWSGITPQSAVCQDINNITDFGLPEMYRVTTQGNKSFDIHSSRVLRFVGRELPMWEKQAMMYWGESVLEPVFEEIRKRDNTSFNIVSLMFRAQILGLKDEMLAQKLSGASMNAKQLEQFQQILSAQNAMMSNQGLLVFGKDGGLEQHQYSFGGISDVYHEFMKDIAAAAEIPYEILFGRDSGLGSNGESSLQVYYDRVAHKQTGQLRPQLDKLYPIIAMSCWGEIPKDFGYKFPIARTVTNKERADLCDAFNKPVMDAFNAGLISQEIALKELQQNSKITNVFTNITDEFVERSDKQVSQPGEMGGPFEGGKEETGDEFSGDRAIDSVYSQPGAATHDDFVLGPVDAMKRLHGLDVVIETPKGTRREGTWWRNTMPADYGFVKGTRGSDGDEVDCYIGPMPSSPIAFVVDQNRLDGSGRFDEHKCFLGFDSVDAAQTCYMEGHTDGMNIFRGIAALPMPDFKQWLKHGNHRKPITNYYRDVRTFRALDAEFEESEHPRVSSGSKGGQFTKGSGSGLSAAGKSSHLELHENRETWPEHIKALKLPPAWKDVRVSSDPDADLLAIGKDAKGRSQYVYSERFAKKQAALKFARIQSLQKDAPMIESQLNSLRKARDMRERDHADCAKLIFKMGIRPGSDTDTRSKKKAYGATTLEGRHVVTEDGKTFLRFIGKDGVSLNLPVEDKELASSLRQRAKNAGPDGRLFGSVRDNTLRDFVHDELDHGGYKVKDMRTLLANNLAADAVAQIPIPKDKKEYNRAVRDVAKRVSEKLGNTPSIALSSYINPVVFGSWSSYAAA